MPYNGWIYHLSNKRGIIFGAYLDTEEDVRIELRKRYGKEEGDKAIVRLYDLDSVEHLYPRGRP